MYQSQKPRSNTAGSVLSLAATALALSWASSFKANAETTTYQEEPVNFSVFYDDMVDHLDGLPMSPDQTREVYSALA